MEGQRGQPLGFESGSTFTPAMEGGWMVLDGKPIELIHLDVWTSQAAAAIGGGETLQGRSMCLHGGVCQTYRMA